MTAVLLAACTAVPEREPSDPVGPVLVPQGIQIGEEGEGVLCDEVEHPVVDPSVPQGALSFSAEEFLAALPVEPIEGTLEIAGGGAAPMVLTLSPIGPVRYVEQVPGPSRCAGAWYRADVSVALAGRPYLDEQLLQWAEARDPESASLVGAVHLDALRGSLRPPTLVADEWEQVVLDLPAQHDSYGWRGAPTWWAWSGVEGDGEAAATWSTPGR